MRLEKQARFVNKEVTKCGTEPKRKNAPSHTAKQPADRVVVGAVVRGAASHPLWHMEITLPRQAQNPRQVGIFFGDAMPLWQRLPTPKDGLRRSMPRPSPRKT